MLWILFTLIAAMAQTLRNAMQRDLVTTLGTAGATYVRFLYGLPFAVIFLAGVTGVTGLTPPRPDLAALAWVAWGALSQILATGLMLAAMRDKSFVVTIAYTKTEPVQVALFSLLVLHEKLNPVALAAIGLATLGVLLLSWPQGRAGRAPLKPALLGLASAACFALSAIGFRAGILRLETASFILAASTALVLGLVLQSGLIGLYLLCANRPLLRVIAHAWRPSLFAGFLGAFASQFWFLAFAISSAALVRTLALVEVLFAQIISRKLFREGASLRELLGMGVILLGVILLLNG